MAERSDALIELQILADIATEGALICDGMMRTVAALFGGELMAVRRDANLIGQHFGSRVFHDMGRSMQAVRHGVPVDIIEEGNLDAALHYGNHSIIYSIATC